MKLLGNSSHRIPSELLSCCLSCWDAILITLEIWEGIKTYFFSRLLIVKSHYQCLIYCTKYFLHEMLICIWIRAWSLALTNVYICKCSKRRNEATPELFFFHENSKTIQFPFLQRWNIKQKYYVFIFGHKRALFIPSLSFSHRVHVLCSWWRSFLYWTEVFLYFSPALLMPNIQGKPIMLRFIWSFYRSQCSII